MGSTPQLLGRITKDTLGFALAAWTSLVLTAMLAGKMLEKDSLLQWGERMYEMLDFKFLPFLQSALPIVFRAVAKVVLSFLRTCAKMFTTFAGLLRRSVRFLYNAFGAMFRHAILPFILSGRRVLWVIWNNPLLPLAFSISVLYMAYLLHIGQIEMPSVNKLAAFASKTSAVIEVLKWGSAQLNQFVSSAPGEW
jgi:hypothetical protein